jgi:RNA polymerase sigma factor (sigma-70 family)
MIQDNLDQRPDQLNRFIANGDEAAFRELVELYQRMVYTTCQRILDRCPGEVDDAVQETFLKLARSAPRIESNLGAWLHSCARTTALNRLRSVRLRSRREFEIGTSQAAVALADAEAPEDPLEQHDELQVIEDLVDELPKQERELVVAYYYLGQTQQQIADRLGVSQVAVQKRLKGVLEVLRHRCTKRGLTVATLLLALEMQSQAAVPATIAAHLAAMPVPAPVAAAHGLALTPVVATAIAAAFALGMGLMFVLTGPGAGRHPSGTAPAAVNAAAGPAQAPAAPPSRVDPAPVVAGAVAPPAASPVPPAVAQPSLPFHLDLAPARWRLKQASAEAVTLSYRGKDIPGLHLTSDRTLLVGVATSATPALPDSFQVDFLLHSRVVWCPFSSLWLEPGLAGRDPLNQPLREVGIEDNCNTLFPAGSWAAIRVEFSRDDEGALTEDVLVNGKSIRHLVEAHAPAATAALSLRVLDTDCDVAEVVVSKLAPKPQLTF